MNSILSYLMNGDTRTPITPIPLNGKRILPIGFDNGNDAAKIAIPNERRLSTLRVPTAMMPASTIRAGAAETTYSMEGYVGGYWVGDVAVRHGGDALPIGGTVARLRDARMRPFIAASIVEALVSAGCKPGRYHVALGIAIPNTEIEVIRVGDADERLGVTAAVREALVTHLKDATLQVTRSTGTMDEQWVIHIAALMPQAQTTGSILLYTRSPTGQQITDLQAAVVIDIGGGDLQATNVAFNPYQIISTRHGDGTIRIARALRALRGSDMTDVAAQQALVTRKILASGRWVDIGDDINQLCRQAGGPMIAALLPALQQTSRFLIVTGGGLILLSDMLKESLQEKREGQDYVLVPDAFASVANAIGALYGVYFMLQN